MQVRASTVQQLLLTEVEVTPDEVSPTIRKLDPITIVLDNPSRGHGTLTITCGRSTWSHRWSSTGDECLIDFLLQCDNAYLANKLGGAALKKYTTDYSPGAWVKCAREAIVRIRLEGGFTKAMARDYWNRAADLVLIYDLTGVERCRDTLCTIFGRSWYNECAPITADADYQYLWSVLNATRVALKLYRNPQEDYTCQ